MGKVNSFRTGQHVKWSWGTGEGTGQVEERFERVAERTIKGSLIKRNGSAEEPAYLIEQEDGARVLKLVSELEAEG